VITAQQAREIAFAVVSETGAHHLNEIATFIERESRFGRNRLTYHVPKPTPTSVNFISSVLERNGYVIGFTMGKDGGRLEITW